MLSLDEIPVSSAAIRSSTDGAIWPVVSIRTDSAIESLPLTPATDRAFAVSEFCPSDKLTFGWSKTNPVEISVEDNVRVSTIDDPPSSKILSPATNGLPEISTPSIATLNIGRTVDVTLSRAEIPVSVASVMFGAPGVPGTRLSTTKLS